MKLETCASPILGWNEKSRRHSCILLVNLVLPSSLLCSSFSVILLSVKALLKISAVAWYWSNFGEDIRSWSSYRHTLKTLTTLSLQVKSTAIVQALTSSLMLLD